MAVKSDATHWGSLAKFFHWTTVLAILVQATIGLVMVNLPKRPSTIPVYTFHKSLGLTILAFAVLRLTWRLFDRRPDEPPTVPQWQVTAARIGHALLYTLIFAVPLSGWLFDSATALRPLYWFGLFQVPSLTGGPDKALKEITEALHIGLFWTLAAVAAGHATVALIHHFHDRDAVLRRMLPGRRTAAGEANPLP
ncbi:MAG TPA: cytochrome b [Rhodanobacteraceae bacterium]|nr:cytochrome b [Rhodanobacteraceae bacterium]